MRRPIGDMLMSAGSAVLVIVALVAFDDRVRQSATALLSGDPAVAARTAGDRLRDFGLVFVGAVRDQALDHGPLVIFALGATVLVLFMLRT